MRKQELLKQLNNVHFWRTLIIEHKETLRWMSALGNTEDTRKQRKHIEEEVDQLCKAIKETTALINNVDDTRLRLLLIAKYINGKTLEQIAEELNYTPRHISELHQAALKIILSKSR